MHRPEPAVIEQTWASLKQRVTATAGGRIPTAQPPAPTRATDPDEAARRDLVLANRIMAAEEVGVLDSFGHVSVRSPSDPTRYFVAPGVAAGLVTAGDIVARSLTDPGGQSPGLSIHDEVYKARPDVMAVVYAETPEVVMMSKSPVGLRPIGIPYWDDGDGFKVFDPGRLDRARPLTNPALGRGVAEALADKQSAGVLLPGQGFVMTSRSLYALTDQAYSLRMTAIIQQQAVALRGKVAYLDDPPPPPAPDAKPSEEEEGPGPTFPDGEPAGEGRDWVYWRQMYGPAD
jgi:HCOMODA/2-hydroxy-3-carboxy-muconic semialdehyde decarboxylase